jgi:hypothetical protein
LINLGKPSVTISFHDHEGASYRVFSHSSAECGKLSLNGWAILRREILALSNESPNGWHRSRLFASIFVIHRELPIAVLLSPGRKPGSRKPVIGVQTHSSIRISRVSKPLSKGATVIGSHLMMLNQSRYATLLSGSYPVTTRERRRRRAALYGRQYPWRARRGNRGCLELT